LKKKQREIFALALIQNLYSSWGKGQDEKQNENEEKTKRE